VGDQTPVLSAAPVIVPQLRRDQSLQGCTQVGRLQTRSNFNADHMALSDNT